MLVRDLVQQKGTSAITVSAGSALSTAIHLIMHRGIGGLPVVGSDGAVVGFVAERDIVGALERGRNTDLELRVDDVMRRPAPTCDAGETLQDVMVRMSRDRLRHLAVLEGGRLIGVISVGDLVKHRLEQLETEAGVLRDYVVAQRAFR
jgi:CBS domain-containing protein